MAMSRWQTATYVKHQTRVAAEREAQKLKKVNPRRQFKVFKIRGPRGGEYYEVSVYLTDREYKRGY